MIELTVSEPTEIELEVVEGKIKPEVAGHVTPRYSAQTVYPAAGTVFGSVEVDAIPDPTAIKEIGSNGDHDVRRYGTARVSVTPTLQSKTATPTEQAQTILPDAGYDGLESVEIGRIPTEYIIPTGKKNITQNGVEDVREYDSVNVQVVPTLQDKTVTPTKQTQTVTADSGYDGLDTVQVDPIPSEYIVPQGKTIITQNGTVDVSQFSEAEVSVTPTGIVFTAYNEDGLPTAVNISGISTFPKTFASASRPIFQNIETLVVNGATEINDQSFEYWTGLKSVTINSEGQDVTLKGFLFRYDSAIEDFVINGNPSFSYTFMNNGMKRLIINGNVRAWSATFYGNPLPAVELYDFSRCTSVFTLQNVSWLPYAQGCVIKVPSSLLSAWQTATNWNALTGVVWEGV